MRNGYTVIELILVIAVIGILTAVSSANLTKNLREAKLQDTCLEASSILDKAYTKGSQTLDYSAYAVTFSKSGSSLILELSENGAALDTYEVKGINISSVKIDGTSYISMPLIIKFKHDGMISLNEGTSEEKTGDIVEIELNSESYTSITKTIEIKSLPPGSVTIKQVAK